MNHLPESLRRRVEQDLDLTIRSTHTIGGGCIANATRLETDRGARFLKYATGEAGRTFEAEAEGLGALARANADIVIPRVDLAAAPSAAAPGFLVTEFLEEGAADGGFWERFGRSLALMHRSEGESYGFHIDNFIGRLPQQNDPVGSWPSFFAERRLDPQRRMAEERGRWRSSWHRHYDALLARLPEILPGSPPKSVLHGDLWSGNVLVTRAASPALIDPATYYGHGETDLAMAALFGGFERTFFEAYHELWPRDDGYLERREIYQLYHLVNHLNHFGGSYAGSVERILGRF